MVSKKRSAQDRKYSDRFALEIAGFLEIFYYFDKYFEMFYIYEYFYL